MTAVTENPETGVTDAPETVALAEITVHPQYRRRDIGKLRDLQQSIRKNGLLRPVPITADGSLIAGERRLHACRNIGWDHIPVVVAADNDHALKLLIAEHEDTGPGHKPRTASELVLLGLHIEEFEHHDAMRRRLEGARYRRTVEGRRESRNAAIDATGLSKHYYVQIRRIALASIGLESTTGGHGRRQVSAEWVRDARQTLDIIDRIFAGERIDYVGPSGRHSPLAMNAVYERWIAEHPATPSSKVPQISDDTSGSEPEPVSTPPATIQRSQREALAKGLATLTGLCHGLASITQIDASITSEEAAAFDRDLSNASRVLRGLHNKIKEYANGNA